MSKKQSSIEWLFFELSYTPKDKFEWHSMLRKAKAMHKEEIENAFVECWKANMPDGYECKLSAKEYYNETFGGNNE